MAAAVAAYPVSGSITSKETNVRITVTGAPVNTATGYNTSHYPASPAVTYYLAFEKGGTELGRSYVFGPDSDGIHVFNNYIFPSSGAWTVRLRKAADDSSVTTTALTVA